jgi:uncharacterized protein YjdB
MADTIEVGATKLLKVEGRDPFADETATEDSGDVIITIGAAAADGTVSVTGITEGTANITVQPGSEDGARTAGTDTVTVVAAADTSPLNVSLA